MRIKILGKQKIASVHYQGQNLVTHPIGRMALGCVAWRKDVLHCFVSCMGQPRNIHIFLICSKYK